MKIKKDDLITIESPSGRTLGECLHDEFLSIRMIHGQFVSTLHIKDKPKRMQREEALAYYTKKLNSAWDKLI